MVPVVDTHKTAGTRETQPVFYILERGKPRHLYFHMMGGLTVASEFVEDLGSFTCKWKLGWSKNRMPRNFIRMIPRSNDGQSLGVLGKAPEPAAARRSWCFSETSQLERLPKGRRRTWPALASSQKIKLYGFVQICRIQPYIYIYSHINRESIEFRVIRFSHIPISPHIQVGWCIFHQKSKSSFVKVTFH